MAQIVRIAARRRSELGKAAMRRLRREGLVPGNVYGHGQEAVAVALSADDIRPVVASGDHVVDLDVDGSVEKTLIRDVQWDTFSKYIQHLDFLRVDPNERVTLSVPVLIRGTAPGVISGGLLQQPLHALHIECPAIQIPDNIPVRVGALEIGQAVHVREIADLPEGVKIIEHPDAVVVQIVKPGVVEVATADEGAIAPAEPELIKRERKTEDDDA